MFTSQEILLPEEVFFASPSPEDFNVSYIITNKVFMSGAAEEAPSAKVAEAFP
jgi:hypothetical protein